MVCLEQEDFMASNRTSGTRYNMPVKGVLSAAIIFMAMPTWLVAQVSITLKLQSAKALLYEDVIAAVVVCNNSGQMLAMDSAHGPVRFFFDVERDDGRLIRRREDVAMVKKVEIMPGEAHQFELNIARLYPIRNPGTYKMRAGVEMNGANYISPKATLEVISGFEFQRLTAGVPGEPQAIRTYVLSYYQKEGVENIYLLIEGNDKAVYGLFNLGRVLRVRPPELKVDEAGNVHVLFQTMGMMFVHTAFTPYGVQLFAKTYTGTRGRAALAQMPNGQIVVSGGTETPPPLLPEDKAALDKAKKKIGTGGMIGKFVNPAPDNKP